MKRLSQYGAMLLGLVALAVVNPVHAAQRAADPAAPAATLQAVADAPELTEELIERYLASMREMQAFAREIEGRDEEPDAAEAMRLQQEQAELLEHHGFDQQTWMQAHERIFQAAMAVAMDRQMGDAEIEQQALEQRQRIQDEEGLSTEQKEMMLEQIDQQLKAYREIQDNPDAAIVEPYFDEFQEIFDGAM